MEFWDAYDQCYKPPTTKFDAYLNQCSFNSTALELDIESPINSIWRFFRSGFCLFIINVKKIGYNLGISENIVNNNTQYSDLLLEYKAQEIVKYKNDSFRFKENDFENIKYNVPQFYEKKMLDFIVKSFANYDYLISDLNYLNYLKNNLNNKDFNWTDTIKSESYNNTNNNLTLRNFTLDEISKISEKLNYFTFIGYEVILLILFFYLLIYFSLISQ